MKTDETDDTLNALRDELAGVAPSPEFVVRVRQGIEADAGARGTSWLFGWRWVMPAAAAAAVVSAVAVFAISRPRSEAPVQVIVNAPVKAASPAVKPTETGVAPVPKPAGAQVRGANFEVRTPKSGSRPAVSVAVTPVGPDLTVLTDQPALLRAMWARLENRAKGQPAETVPVEIGEIVIAPLEIVPVVVKWLVEPLPPPDVGALPIIRRLSVLAAERSLQ